MFSIVKATEKSLLDAISKNRNVIKIKNSNRDKKRILLQAWRRLLFKNILKRFSKAACSLLLLISSILNDLNVVKFALEFYIQIL